VATVRKYAITIHNNNTYRAVLIRLLYFPKKGCVVDPRITTPEKLLRVQWLHVVLVPVTGYTSWKLNAVIFKIYNNKLCKVR